MSPAIVNSTTLRWCLAYILMYQKESPRSPKISGPGSNCHLGEWKSNKVVRFCYSSKEYMKMLLGFISWCIKDWSCRLPYCTVLMCFVSCAYLYGDFCFYPNRATGPLTFRVTTTSRAPKQKDIKCIPSFSESAIIIPNSRLSASSMLETCYKLRKVNLTLVKKERRSLLICIRFSSEWASYHAKSAYPNTP